jgi:hypothetical protein
MSVEEEVLRIHKKLSKMTSSGVVSSHYFWRKTWKKFARLVFLQFFVIEKKLVNWTNFLFSLNFSQDNQAQALDLLKALQGLKIDLEILTNTR